MLAYFQHAYAANQSQIQVLMNYTVTLKPWAYDITLHL